MIIETDIRLLVLCGIAAVAVSMLLVLLGRGAGQDGSRNWLLAAGAALLLAAAGVLMRPVIGFVPATMLVVGGPYAAVACAWIALAAATGCTAPRLAIAGVGLPAIAAQGGLALWLDAVEPLIVSASAVNGGLALAAMRALWRGAAPYGRHVAAFVALPFALLAAAYLFRIGAILLLPQGQGYRIATGLLVLLLPFAAVGWSMALAVLREAQLSRDLRAAHAAAEAVSRGKSDFLRAMSHELRTPLNAVIGLSDLMKMQLQGPLGPKYLSFAEHINTSGQYLLGLINDLLDLSAAEAGRLSIEEGEVDLDAVFDTVFALLAERAKAAGVALARHPPGAVRHLRGDARRITQIIVNLATNAIKYSPRGSTVDIAAALAANGAVVISVRDDGPGMTAEEAEVAMHLFGRVGGETNAKIEGTGIGLPLSRELAEAHGGTLVLDSAPGFGTTAVLTLPAERRAMADVRPPVARVA